MYQRVVVDIILHSIPSSLMEYFMQDILMESFSIFLVDATLARLWNHVDIGAMAFGEVLSLDGMHSSLRGHVVI